MNNGKENTTPTGAMQPEQASETGTPQVPSESTRMPSVLSPGITPGPHERSGPQLNPARRATRLMDGRESLSLANTILNEHEYEAGTPHMLTVHTGVRRNFLHAKREQLDELLNDLLKEAPTSTAAADQDVFKKPVGPAPRKRIRSSSTYSRKDVLRAFQHESDPDTPPGPRLKKDAESALMEISERFVQKVKKRLQRRLEEQNRTVLCPADIKAIMDDFGWLPEQDPNDVKFHLMLMEYLEPEKQRAVIPMAKLGGGPGETTVPRDFWTKIPKEKRKRRRGRETSD